MRFILPLLIALLPVLAFSQNNERLTTAHDLGDVVVTTTSTVDTYEASGVTGYRSQTQGSWLLYVFVKGGVATGKTYKWKATYVSGGANMSNKLTGQERWATTTVGADKRGYTSLGSSYVIFPSSDVTFDETALFDVECWEDGGISLGTKRIEINFAGSIKTTGSTVWGPSPSGSALEVHFEADGPVTYDTTYDFTVDNYESTTQSLQIYELVETVPTVIATISVPSGSGQNFTGTVQSGNTTLGVIGPDHLTGSATHDSTSGSNWVAGWSFGMPTAPEDFAVEMDILVVGTTQAHTVELLDAEGNIIGQFTLPAGTYQTSSADIISAVPGAVSFQSSTATVTDLGSDALTTGQTASIRFQVGDISDTITLSDDGTSFEVGTSGDDISTQTLTSSDGSSLQFATDSEGAIIAGTSRSFPSGNTDPEAFAKLQDSEIAAVASAFTPTEDEIEDLSL